MRELRAFCDENKILLIFDEVQAGFGRCGKMWGFQHYGVKADMIVCGKGIGSGMPLSAVIGASAWMNIFPPGSMTSTHTGNPVCCAAALANIKLLIEEDLIGNAARLEAIFKKRMAHFEEKYPDHVGRAEAVGLVAAIQMVAEKGSTTPPSPSSNMPSNAASCSSGRSAPAAAPSNFVRRSVSLRSN